ncbi:alpha-(1,3)-fucosyltransferase 10-like [Pectinophora gossypiella]|uniref:alpha-(1,3)-fucosyltransferase 10-like n=1 Tax=Pectinophora gossypiella TaxID=13191 RepID=UPI00214F3783|nr:alpha-(1,3)-fucosyltransferase 10-like [Pectinophora gossypiella]
MDIDRLPLPRENKTIWALFHEESPRNTPIFMHEKALNLFNFSSTFNKNSDVPIPLYHLESLDAVTTTRYFVNTSIKNSILNEISPIVFFQSNCYTFTGRDEYVTTLMKYIKVDSYGLCLHNKDIDLPTLSKNPLVDDELMNVLAKYKFMIAIENAACIDYVTEKFWRAIELGVVPIYYGSPLIRDWLPNNKSAILLEDFPTPKLLSQYLRYLLQNNSAYEEYLEHKTLGIISNRKLSDEISAREYDKTLLIT